MTFLYAILLMVAGFMDLSLLYGFAVAGWFSLWQFVLFHCVIYLLLWLVYSRIESDDSGYPFYLALFMPGLGLLMLCGIFISVEKNRHRGDSIEEYESYIEYINQLGTEKKVDVEHEIRTLSARDSLLHSTHSKKKEMIIDIIQDDIETKAILLKHALLDDDPEVVHYAASSINLIEKEFENKLTEHRKLFAESHENEALFDLVDVYDKYWSSGLLDGEMLRVFLLDYLKFLKTETGVFSNSDKIMIKRIKVQIALGNTAEAMDSLHEFRKSYPCRFETHLLFMKLLYEEKKYEELGREARKTEELGFAVPGEYAGILDYWRKA